MLITSAAVARQIQIYFITQHDLYVSILNKLIHPTQVSAPMNETVLKLVRLLSLSTEVGKADKRFSILKPKLNEYQHFSIRLIPEAITSQTERR